MGTEQIFSPCPWRVSLYSASPTILNYLLTSDYIDMNRVARFWVGGTYFTLTNSSKASEKQWFPLLLTTKSMLMFFIISTVFGLLEAPDWNKKIMLHWVHCIRNLVYFNVAINVIAFVFCSRTVLIEAGSTIFTGFVIDLPKNQNNEFV